MELKSQGMAQVQPEPARTETPTTAPVAEPAPQAQAPAPAVPPEPQKPQEPPPPEVKPAPQPTPPQPAVVEPPKATPVQATAPEDMSLLLGGGGILALLLGWGGYKIYQRRTAGGAPTTTPALSEFGEGSNSVFGSAGGQSVDTGLAVRFRPISASRVFHPSIRTRVSIQWLRLMYTWLMGAMPKPRRFCLTL